MNKMNFIYMWIAGWFTACMLCIYQHFMKIWVGTDLMYPFAVVVLLCVYFYILKMGDVRYIYEQAKGLWWEYRYRSISEALGNIFLNYLLGRFFGVYGIIIATILTLFFINYIYGAKVIFKSYFINQNILQYFLQNGIYAVVALVACFITYISTVFIPYTWFGFGARLIICMLVPNIIMFILLFRTTMFKESYEWAKGKMKFLK